jgi:uncharacterized repeat protein (TIGR03803 family)
MEDLMSRANVRFTMVFACAFCAAGAAPSPAQNYPLATLASFNGTNGQQPFGSLIQGTDGNFYGTTTYGGASGCGDASGCGTVFKMTPTGTLTTLYSFCPQSDCTDGYWPTAGLVQGRNGNFYGTTSSGGVNEHPPNAPAVGGTVFEITPGGVLTTLYSFCSESPGNGVCSDGDEPMAAMILGTDGNLYGTTNVGGAFGSGTVFQMTPRGKLTTLYNFCSQSTSEVGVCTDGARPTTALVQGSNGSFYGTTQSGGATGNGTVFETFPNPTIATNIHPHFQPYILNTLYSFCSEGSESNCLDGKTPTGLVQASNGKFYGTTLYGGPDGGGEVFELTPAVPLTTENKAIGLRTETLYFLLTLHGFCSETGCTDGQYATGLVQGSNGNFYGTTYMQGGYGGGTVVEITPEGALTTLHGFCFEANCADGNYPTGLVQASNGNLYGTTYYGGAHGDGTVFSFPPTVPPICYGIVSYYIFREDIAVSNGGICQFFGGGLAGMPTLR